MSMSGSSTLNSRTTQAIPARTDTAKRPSTAGDVQPQLSPSERPRRNVASIAEKRIAPGTSTRDCERTGDSGTKRRTRTIETAIAAAPTTKIQRQLTLSTRNPESTRPSPPPTPKTAERRPMPTLTRSPGNSSRMIPTLSGNTAPPVPETNRAAISHQMFGATAQAAQPTRNTISEATRSRSFPKRSPSLPRIGVKTAAESRNAVNTHVTHVVDASRSR